MADETETNEIVLSTEAKSDGKPITDTNAEGYKESPYLPKDARKCTDLFCLLIFIIYWIGMFVLLGLAVKFGHPYKLIYGDDSVGNTCGIMNTGNNAAGVPLSDMQSKKYTVYPRITEDILLQTQSLKLSTANPLSFSFFSICAAKCPAVNDIICTDAQVAANAKTWPDAATRATQVRQCVTNSLPNILQSTQCTEVRKSCFVTLLDTQNVFWRCIPKIVTKTLKNAICTHPLPSICNNDKDCGTAATDKCLNMVNGTGVCNALLATDPRCKQSTTNTTTMTTQPTQSNVLFSALSSASQLYSRYFGDVGQTWVVILVCGTLGAMAFGFLWVLFLRTCAGCMVWTTVIAFFLTMIAATLFCLLRGGVISQTVLTQATSALGVATSQLPSVLTSSPTSNATAFQVVGWILAGVSIILLFILIGVAHKINITVGIVREAAKAVQKMPLMTFYPFFTVLALAGLTLYFGIVAVLLMSAGQLQVADLVKAGTASAAQLGIQTGANSTVITTLQKYQSNDVLRYLAVYHLFGFLWTSQWVQAIGMAALAGAVSKWYFSRDKNQLGFSPVLESLQISMRFHMGSMAFGAFLIALVQVIRIALAYIDRQTQNAQQRSKLVAFAMKCIQCCMWCFEKCLKFINKNVYILIAMKGESFCAGCKNAFELLKDNLVTIGTVTAVGNLMIFLGKLIISVLCTMVCFIWLSYDPTYSVTGSKPITSPFVPCILTLVLSFLIASAFLYVFEMTIDTILLCYCEDIKAEPFFAGDGLRNYLREAGESGNKKGGNEIEQ